MDIKGQFQTQEGFYMVHILLALHEPSLMLILTIPKSVYYLIYNLFWAALNCDLAQIACAGLILRLRALCSQPLGYTSTRLQMISVGGCMRMELQ